MGVDVVGSEGRFASFTKARSLWALAAVGLVAWGCVGLLQWQQTQPKFEDNWQDLCEQTDCSRYRMGHTTIELADVAIKVPFSNGPVQLYLNAPGDEFMQVNNSGGIARSVVRNAQGLTITPCCGSLSHLLPSASGWFIGERVDVYSSASRWADEEAKRLSKIIEEHPVIGSWDDGIDLLRAGSAKAITLGKIHLQRPEWAKALGTEYKDLLLVTKMPVAFGRRALFDCRQSSCQVDLLNLEGQAELPVTLSISSANIQPTGDCASLAEGCLTREQMIGQLPDKLRTLEALIIKLSE